MPPIKPPFEDTPTFEVYKTYRDYVLHGDESNDEDAPRWGGGRPTGHAFWRKILTPRLSYQMPWGSFMYHWQQLQIKKNPATNLPYIVINETGAIIVPEIDIELIKLLNEKQPHKLP